MTMITMTITVMITTTTECQRLTKPHHRPPHPRSPPGAVALLVRYQWWFEARPLRGARVSTHRARCLGESAANRLDRGPAHVRDRFGGILTLGAADSDHPTADPSATPPLSSSALLHFTTAHLNPTVDLRQPLRGARTSTSGAGRTSPSGPELASWERSHRHRTERGEDHGETRPIGLEFTRSLSVLVPSIERWGEAIAPDHRERRPPACRRQPAAELPLRRPKTPTTVTATSGSRCWSSPAHS